MKTSGIAGTLIILIFLSHTAKSQLCFPANFGGIVPGMSLVQDVVALYGEGYFDEASGHGGGHVYTNAAMTATMEVRTDVDFYIESVWIIKGLAFPDSVLKNAMTYFSPRFEITNNGSLQVGLDASKEIIKAKYGVPTLTLNNDNIWKYNSGRPPGEMCFIETALTFWFENDKVTTIIFTGPEE